MCNKEECCCPVCPEQLVEGMMWWPDEEICRKREHRESELVRSQRERVACSGSFVVKGGRLVRGKQRE